MVYKPARCLRKILMWEFDLDCLKGIRSWYVNGNTSEAIEDLEKLKRHSLQYIDDTRTFFMQYIRVVQFCVKHGVCARSAFLLRD
ncbi:hypothetical protein Hanom_Chr13g01202461 [Helianthus anomalus]